MRTRTPLRPLWFFFAILVVQCFTLLMPGNGVSVCWVLVGIGSLAVNGHPCVAGTGILGYLAQASACVYPNGKRPLPAVRLICFPAYLLTCYAGPSLPMQPSHSCRSCVSLRLPVRVSLTAGSGTLPVRIGTGGRLRQIPEDACASNARMPVHNDASDPHRHQRKAVLSRARKDYKRNVEC
jgi:hypothetical protein